MWNSPFSSSQIVPLGLNAKRVIGKRYSLKDAKGQPFEDWEAIVSRVVGHVSKAETDPVRLRGPLMSMQIQFEHERL